MKVPTKSDLYNRIMALEKENAALKEQLEAEQQKRWREGEGKARRVLFESIPFTVLQTRLLRLDHIDTVGYWFTFYVDSGNALQTYCVRHTDIKG